MRRADPTAGPDAPERERQAPSAATAVARGGAGMLLATLIGSAAGLGLDLYVNGLLSLGDYGLYGAWRRLLLFAGLATQAGMENAVIRRVAAGAPEEADGVVRAALRGTLGLSVIGALALLLAAGPLARGLDPGPQQATTAALVLVIGAMSLPFAAVRLVAVSASQGFGALRHRAVVMFLAWPALQGAGLLLLVHGLGLGVVGAALAYTGAMAGGAALALLQLRRLRPAAVGLGGGGAFLALLAFSWPLWLQSFLGAVYAWADQVLLAGLRDTATAGAYGPVAALLPLFGLGLGALNNSFAPQIARRHADGDHAELAALYRTVTRWALVVTLPPTLVCLVLPEVVLDLWPAGDASAAPALRLVAGANLFGTAVGSVNYLLIMSGRPRASLINGVLAAVVSLGASVLLIPRWGVTGAALANAAATLVSNGVGLAQVWAGLRLHPFHPALLKVAAAGTVAGALLGPLGGVALSPWIVGPAAGALATGAVLGVLGMLGLSPEDRELVERVSQRARVALRRGGGGGGGGGGGSSRPPG